jgi:hypothetical protein
MEGSLVAYKVFTNGSVLQASEINDNLMRQSVMVFSNSAARSAAITSPVEGMLTWLQDINDYQYYNGSAWIQLVAPTGMTLLSTTDFAGAGVVDVTSVFSSTYQNYQVELNINTVSASLSPYFQLLSGSTPATTNYSRAGIRLYSNAATIESERGNLVSTLQVGLIDTGNTGAIKLSIFDPQIARATKFAYSSSGVFSAMNLTDVGTGRHTTATAYDGLRVGASTGNFTGTVRIYGVRNA